MDKRLKHLYEFGRFRLDGSECLLLRDGEVVSLTPKAFDLLRVMVERPGQLLTKEELLQAVWPGTLVEENNLADNISKLRKALGDDGNGQRFIETVPKRGYRFSALVEVVRASTTNGATQELVDEPSPPRPDQQDAPSPLRIVKSWRVAILGLATTLLISALLMGSCYGVRWITRERFQPHPPTLRPFTQFTFGNGLQSEPTWSPDGKMIAYISDRSGNFDIWVQQPGSKSVQVTNSSAHDWQPDWSPDGNQIVVRSERNGGGLFVVPALGGAEQRIASSGYRPRWSRDGSQILFSSSALQHHGPPRLYVVGIDGASPREVLAEFLSGIIGMRGFAWRPDGQGISIWGEHHQLGLGFWTIPLSGGAAIKSEIIPEVEQPLKVAAVTLGNFLWAPSGRYLYFEGVSQGVKNVWRITVEPQTLRWIAGPDRLTTSPGQDGDISISGDGKKLALTTRLERTGVWSLPFDPLSGQLKGNGQPITRPGIDAWGFDVTRDGKQIAFVTLRSDTTELNAPRQTPKNELWKKSLMDGREMLLAPADEFFRLYPRWSPDGARLAYSHPRQFKPGSADLEWLPVVLSADGGEEQLLSSANWIGITDWSPDGQWILGHCRSSPQGKSQTCLAPISAAPHVESAMRVIAADPNLDFKQARFSPDQRWVAAQAIKRGGFSTIYSIPASGGALKQVTDGKHWDDKPRWAPDGATIYFVTDRGGFLNVWGVRFDSAKGEAVGEPFRVTAFESPSRMVFPNVALLNLEITADRLFLNISEISGNIWVLDNVDRWSMPSNAHKTIYEFPPFRLDAGERQLMRNGEAISLTPKSFELLRVLVERPGRLLTKEELLQAVWPDAFVEDNNLADNISKLRKALGDGDNGHRYIETVPKQGYRFAACVREVAPDYNEKAKQGPEEQPETRNETDETSQSRTIAGRLLVQVRSHSLSISLVLSAIALGIIGVSSVRTWHAPPIQPPRTLTRLTFDAGLQTAPTWSRDGRMIAYGSDHSGNFDIWVQSVSGGDPVQVTHSPAQDWQPDWSPDGSEIAFRSERNGGGLFIVPAFGGAEHRISDFGHLPKWSRDGSQILFSSSALQETGMVPKLYVMGRNGSSPHEVLAGFLSRIKMELFDGYAWHPDGQRISVWAEHREIGRGFWTLSLPEGEPVKSEMAPDVEQRLQANGVTLRNFLWSSSGRYLYFEGVSHGVRDIWRITVEPNILRWVGGPDRLTTSEGKWAAMSISPDGTKLALAAQEERTRVWSLPFNPISHELTGDGRPESRVGTNAWSFGVTRDGKQLVFATQRADRNELNAPPQIAKNELWKKSLTDGKESLLMPSDEFFRLFPHWSPDGRRLSYGRYRFNPGTSDKEWVPVLLSADGGEEQVVGRPLQAGGRLFISDWSADGLQVLGFCRDSLKGRYQIYLAALSSAPHLESGARVIAADPSLDFFQARFSPDQRWIAIQAVKYLGLSTIYAMPASGGALKQVTDAKHWDDKPRWSPDGKTIYFVSDRGGLLNIWGIRFDSTKGGPVGEPFRVTAFESPSRMVFPRVPQLGLEITADRLFLNISEMSGNIWVLENVDR